MVWVLRQIKEGRKWGQHSPLCFLTVDANDQMPLVPDHAFLTVDGQTEPKSGLVTATVPLATPNACMLLRRCIIHATKVQN